ncbi:hypothetical protein D9619_005167 [Psilocybe cf. subviscida]|uniref:Uncharacterized protein n=1 Tax=Psilocybe cf. subviscida TaxID=2480587 RepID=A0A8H5BVR7_9AGAR|nr:hypothetical protein D9619_005167 [Psilocybe cf. subviscida]
MSVFLARGMLKSTSATKFMGKFMLDKSEYLISGSFTHNLPKFTSSEAMLIIEDKDALSGTRTVEGTIGCDNVLLKFGDTGNRIEAALDAPVCPGQSVTGAGMFSEA